MYAKEKILIQWRCDEGVSIERRVSRRDFDMLEALKNMAKQRISKGDNTVKNIIANIVRGKSLTYLAAAFAALATSSAWAGMVWIGDGADEYIDTTGNRTDGTAYRGNYFVDAITNSNSGVVSYASKTTVRFNSYKDFGNADIRFGRASLTDPDKIWTVIADNGVMATTALATPISGFCTESIRLLTFISARMRTILRREAS